MNEFKRPQLSDKNWVDKFFCVPSNMSCELCFGNLYMWSDIYDDYIIDCNGLFIIKDCYEDKINYSFPLGTGDYKKAFDFIIDDAKNENKQCGMYGITNQQLNLLDEIMPNKFSIETNRDNFDYIYSREKLATLSGKKYHGKRNHIRKFELQNQDWAYEKMSSTNASECINMHRKWIEDSMSEESNYDSLSELTATAKALLNFDELNLLGGLLRVKGEVVAYTFGDQINDKLFCSHVEKAFSQVDGAYPLINQQFAINSLSAYEFVNREEDLGMDGLRKSKLSYRPEILLEKSNALYGG